MQLNLKALLAILALCITSFSKAQTLPCEEYDLSISVHGSPQCYVTFDLSKNGTVTPPVVDSVCITDTKSKVIATYYDKQSKPSGDNKIDISSLERGNYVLSTYIDVGSLHVDVPLRNWNQGRAKNTD